MAFAFSGFNPMELLEMDMKDLGWWYRQAQQLAEEMKGDG